MKDLQKEHEKQVVTNVLLSFVKTWNENNYNYQIDPKKVDEHIKKYYG